MNRRLLTGIAWRLLAAIPILLGMVSVVFFAARLLPGSPFASRIAPGISASTLETLRITYGLDRPLWDQYLLWISNALHGDFGISLTTNRPVIGLIGETLPNTFLLGSVALILQFSLGILLALFSVRKPDGRIDRLMGSATVVVYSVPTFWLGSLLLLVFTYNLNLFPASQMRSVGFVRPSMFGGIVDVLWHVTLPALTAAIPGAARVAGYLRGTLHQVLEQPFILHARSHGLSSGTILFRYALPNALAPAISIGGMETGILLTGMLVTETLFAWPGMGRLTVTAVLSRDYPLLMGTTIVSGAIVIVANLAADVLHRLLDPRIREM